MSKIFTRTFRVRWSELDATGKVSPANYLRYLVETAYDWGESLGLGEVVDDLGLFWLIRETEIEIIGSLRQNDVFDFTIWMINWQRVRGTRCFEITLKDTGQVIAQGTQQIVCMDGKTQRPASLPENIIDTFRLETPREFPFERFPKIPTLPLSSYQANRTVEWQDLDALAHVNNAIYVTYAEEAAAQDFAARGWPPARLAEHSLRPATQRVHLIYLSPAVWGDELIVSSCLLGLDASGGKRYVGLKRADGTAVADCLLDWQFLDQETGQIRLLPESLFESLE